MRSKTVLAGEAIDNVTAALRADLARYATRATHPTSSDPVEDASAAVSGPVRIDRIAVLEQLRSAVAAAQNAEMVAFGREQVAGHLAQIEAGALDPAAVGRGIADQIALACHVSPFHGARRLGNARALASDLPETAGLLAAGRISERVAELVVSQTRHLDSETRRLVDTQLAGAGLDEVSVGRADALAKKYAYDADPAAYVARGRTARVDRRVTLRPAPDTMCVLSGLLPVEQGVACLAALRSRTDAVIAAGGDGRSRDQIMADTLIERVTGQVAATDVNVEVGIVIPLEALLDTDLDGADLCGSDDHDDGIADRESAGTADPSGSTSTGTGTGGNAGTCPRPGSGGSAGSGSGGTAEIVGYGPIPAGIARDILADTNGKLWWRRLFTARRRGPVVDADRRRRRIDGVLAHVITVRDHGRCRDPYCDAPIRHLDHIRPHRAGGPSSYANGRGVCARGNYVREMPGWHVEVVDEGFGQRAHTVRTTTPTGHTYTSAAGPAP